MSQTRREQRAEAAQARRAAREDAPSPTTSGTKPRRRNVPERVSYRATRDRPPSWFGWFGNFPLTELFIVAGAIVFIVGISQGPNGGGQSRIIGGLVLCGIGVFEFTITEHFTGYRSHTALLAGVPAAMVHGIVLLVAPKGSAFLYIVLVPDILIFALGFQVLRSVYKRAKEKRDLTTPKPEAGK